MNNKYRKKETSKKKKNSDLVLWHLLIVSPEAVIERFEQKDYAVDSRGVAEYLRALVASNGIADYLPDEKSGKPSRLPSLVLACRTWFLPSVCIYSLHGYK